MKRLIPFFIVEEFKKGNFSGEFNACSIFVDISGFTKTTEQLMKQGKEGAEVLSEILEHLFEPIVQSIYKNGGFITTFAGDAFTALFPMKSEESPIPQKALNAARMVNRFFTENKIYVSKFGDFEFAVKVGMAAGEVPWGIVGQEESKSYYFRGSAVDNCAQAEHHATQGEIWAENSIFQFIENWVTSKKKKDNFYQIDEIKPFDIETSESNKKSLKIHKDILVKFTSKEMLSFPKGEFREVVSVFISFDNVSDLDQFMTLVLSKIKMYGSSHPRLDFGDKGGNILLFFGTPISHENDLQRALEFILALQKEINPTIKLRAGITKGIMFTGFYGSKLRQEFSCLGNAVNFSARLMIKSQWGQILVSDDVATHPHFNFNHKGDFAYKGFTQKVPTYQLISEKLTEAKFFSGDMIGRADEFNQLKKATAPLFDRKFGGIFYIFGEAGMGKSRLVYELQKSVASQILWLECQSDQIFSKSFNPFIYMFNQYFKLNEYPNEKAKRKAFEKHYQELIDRISIIEGDEVEDIKKELIRTKSIIGALVDLHWKDSLYEQLDAKGKYENTQFAIKNWFQAQSLLQPVIIQMEDAHWIDTDSQGLIKVMCRRTDNFPILIMATLRYNDDGSKLKFPVEDIEEQEIDLNFLSPEDVRKYAEIELEGVIAEGLHQFLLEKTKGNPFFVQQVSHYLKENNFLDKTDSGWEIRGTVENIPETLQSILIARIDRLSQEVKEVVKTAAVIGREFEVSLLSEVLRHDISTPLHEGEEGQIWTSLNELQYLFKHALLRDAAYEMQLKARLRELHHATAQSIERVYAENLESKYADLAFHYDKAEDPEKTLEFLEKAADRAKELYQNEQAIEFYDKLIDMLRVKAGLSKEDLELDDEK